MLPSVSITTSLRLQDAREKGAKRQQERKKEKAHVYEYSIARSFIGYIFFLFFLFHKLLTRSKCRFRHNAQQGTL